MGGRIITLAEFQTLPVIKSMAASGKAIPIPDGITTVIELSGAECRRVRGITKLDLQHWENKNLSGMVHHHVFNTVVTLSMFEKLEDAVIFKLSWID